MTYPIAQINFVKTDTLQLPQVHVVPMCETNTELISMLVRRGYSKQSAKIAHGTTKSFWCKNLKDQTDIVSEMNYLTAITGVLMFPDATDDERQKLYNQ